MITVAAQHRLCSVRTLATSPVCASLVLALLVVATALPTAPAIAADTSAPGMESLLADLAGSYRVTPDDTAADTGGAPPDLTAHYAGVFAPSVGPNTAYWQLNAGEDQRLYRQTLLVFEADGNGAFTQRAYNFRDPELYADGHLRPDIFIGLQPADLVPAVADSCVSIWSYSEAGWSGIMAADSCRMYSERSGTWRHIGAEVLPRGDSLLYVERGFSEDGEMLFGLPDGAHYDLKRIRTEPPANAE